MEITLPASSTADTSHPYVFLKEISTNGDANTVDVVYPTSTVLGVISPDWIKYLLEPVAVFSESSAWSADYVVHDLGSESDTREAIIPIANAQSRSLSFSDWAHDSHFGENPA